MIYIIIALAMLLIFQQWRIVKIYKDHAIELFEERSLIEQLVENYENELLEYSQRAEDLSRLLDSLSKLNSSIEEQLADEKAFSNKLSDEMAILKRRQV